MKIGDKVELIKEDYELRGLSPSVGDCGVIHGFSTYLKKIYVVFDKYPNGSYRVFKSSLRLIKNKTEMKQTLTRKQLITLHSQFTCIEWKTAIEELLKENVLEDKIDVSSKLDLLKSKGTTEQKEAVKKLKITLPKSYLELHNESGLKVGDKVRVIRKAENYEQGWGNIWSTKMNNCLNKTFTLTRDRGESGFELSCENKYDFPYFVLEKVEEKYVPYTFEDAEKLIGKAVKSKNENLITFIGWFKLDQVNIYGEGSISYQELLENYTELDGSPLGKLAEV